MNDWVERYGIAALAALVVHGAAAMAMASVEDDSVLLLSGVVPEPEITLVDIEVEPVILPDPEPEPPEPEPEQEPELPPEPAPPEPKIAEQPPAKAAEPPPPGHEPPPPSTDEPPPPGWADGDDAPGMAFQLGEVGPEGTAKVDVAQGTGNKPGRVGHGSGKGGGGAEDSTGTGARPPKPVSIASIKRRAMPLGNTDLIQAKDYPAEARRLGIEGTVKVELIVDTSGKVAKRTLVKKLGHGFDQLAMRYSQKLRFSPAIDTNDRAVSSVVVWTFRFVLPK